MLFNLYFTLALVSTIGQGYNIVVAKAVPEPVLEQLSGLGDHRTSIMDIPSMFSATDLSEEIMSSEETKTSPPSPPTQSTTTTTENVPKSVRDRLSANAWNVHPLRSIAVMFITGLFLGIAGIAVLMIVCFGFIATFMGMTSTIEYCTSARPDPGKEPLAKIPSQYCIVEALDLV